MKSLINTISFFLFIVSLLTGQSTINEIAAKQDQPSTNNVGLIRTYGVSSFDLRDYSTKGSPYLNDNWKSGSIVLYDDKLIDNIPLKFNLDEQSLAVQIDDKLYVLPNSTFSKFTISDISDHGSLIVRPFVRLVDNSTKTSHYYEVVVSNDGVSLVIDHKIKLIKSNYNKAIDVGSYRDSFVKNSVYGFLVDEKFTPLKGNRKKIMNNLSNRKLVSIIKSENIDLKDIQDVSTMIVNNEF